jgi:hypothetical protein
MGGEDLSDLEPTDLPSRIPVLAARRLAGKSRKFPLQRVGIAIDC